MFAPQSTLCSCFIASGQQLYFNFAPIQPRAASRGFGFSPASFGTPTLALKYFCCWVWCYGEERGSPSPTRSRLIRKQQQGSRNRLYPSCDQKAGPGTCCPAHWKAWTRAGSLVLLSCFLAGTSTGLRIQALHPVASVRSESSKRDARTNCFFS